MRKESTASSSNASVIHHDESSVSSSTTHSNASIIHHLRNTSLGGRNVEEDTASFQHHPRNLSRKNSSFRGSFRGSFRSSFSSLGKFFRRLATSTRSQGSDEDEDEEEEEEIDIKSQEEAIREFNDDDLNCDREDVQNQSSRDGNSFCDLSSYNEKQCKPPSPFNGTMSS